MLCKTCTNSFQDGGHRERQFYGQRKIKRWDSWSLFPTLTQIPCQVASFTYGLCTLAIQLGERVTPWEALVRTCLLHLTRTLAEGQVLRSCHPLPTWHLPEGKLCVHPLLRHMLAGKGLPSLQTPNLQSGVK